MTVVLIASARCAPDTLHSPLKTHAMHYLCLWYDSHCGEVVMVNDCQALCLVLHNKNVQMCVAA